MVGWDGEMGWDGSRVGVGWSVGHISCFFHSPAVLCVSKVGVNVESYRSV